MSRKVPFIAQLEGVECGAAALAMVLAYHGHHAPLSEVRVACAVSRDGSTAFRILAAARRYGLVAKARRCEPSDLGAIAGPAILHWRMEHFVVLERHEPGRTRIVDPGVGPRVVDDEDLDQSFTGIALTFEPGPDLEPRPRQRRSFEHYIELLRELRVPLALGAAASFALALLAYALPVGAQLAVDEVIVPGSRAALVVLAAALAGLTALRMGFALVRGALLRRAQAILDLRLVEGLVGKLFSLSYVFFSQRTTADLVARVETVRRMRDVLAGQAIGVVLDVGMLTASLVGLALVDGEITVVALLGGALFGAVTVLSHRALVAQAQRQSLRDLAADNRLVTLLRGALALKSSGTELRAVESWVDAYVGSLNAGRGRSRTQAVAQAAFLLIQSVVPIAVVGLAARRVLDGRFELGAVVGLGVLLAAFFGPLQSLGGTVLQLGFLPTLFDRMDDVLGYRSERAGGRPAPRLRGRVELEGVSFRYGEGAPEILSSVSFTVEPGQIVAVVGASGSGKSTVLRLLVGLFEPTAGRVLLDGHDLAELNLGSVRRQIGVVLQDTHIFEGTVADNVRAFCPGASIDDVVLAAKAAQLHDDIEALADGYETRIGPASGPLSGGQRQRLMLARAILPRPPILLLDEATSALDAVTEAAIKRYLTTRSTTRIVIAHRLSTVRDADLILVLADGKVVEQGRHEELLGRGGPYAALFAHGEKAAPEDEATAGDPASRVEAIRPEQLDAFDALAPLDADDRRLLASELEVRAFEEGSVLVEQDRRAEGLFLITEGTVLVQIAEVGLPSWEVARLGPGSIVGEVSLLDGSPSSASALAASRVVSLCLPRAQVEQLLARGDRLVARCLVALGGLVATRLLTSLEKLAGATDASDATDATDVWTGDVPEPARLDVPNPGALLQATSVGAALTGTEAAELAALGHVVSLAAGQRLGSGSGSHLAVMLRGHATVALEGSGQRLDSVDAGSVIEPAVLFGEASPALFATATVRSELLLLEREPLRTRVLAGDGGAMKLLVPVAEQLGLRLRLTNLRLRDLAARETENEQDRAAEEERLRRTRRSAAEAGPAPGSKLPLVRCEAPGDTAAAALACVLRSLGRPVALERVAEAFRATPGGATLSLRSVAETFGLSARRLRLLRGELDRATHTLIVVRGDERCSVLEPRGRGSFGVMDPLAGYSVVPRAELEQDESLTAFELRTPERPPKDAPLAGTVARFCRRQAPLLALLVVLSLVTEGLRLGSTFTGAALVGVLPSGEGAAILLVALAGVVVVCGAAAFSWLHDGTLAALRARFDFELGRSIMGHLMSVVAPFFASASPADVLQRFRAVDGLRALLSSEVPALFVVVVSTLLGLGSGAFLVPELLPVGLGALAVLAALGYVALPRLIEGARTEQRERRQAQDRLLESLQSVAAFYVSGQDGAARDHYLPAFSRQLLASVRLERSQGLYRAALDATRDGAFVVGLGVGANAALEGRVGAATFVAGLASFGALTAGAHAAVSRALAGARALTQLAQVHDTLRLPTEETAGRLLPGKLRGSITLDRVSFRYGPDGPLVLDGVSLEIPRGAKVAIVGPSGSGKSTLGKLVLGLYPPSSGRILFDGRDLATLDLTALRKQLGVVLQEPFVVPGTLRENIAMFADEVSFEQVKLAAEKAALAGDLEGLPMGYSTMIAEGGSTLSGGQRQRLMIARALVRDPAVLFFDEATSALDNRSQAAVEQNLEGSRATRVVVAHRLSTIIDADLIVVLVRGRIAEQGRHEELVARGGPYAQLVEAQSLRG